MEAAREFYKEHRQICTVVVVTRRGIHCHFSGELEKSRKIPLGDLKASGYVVYEGVVEGHKRRLIETGPLQPFPHHLFPIETKETNTQPIIEDDTLRRITRARLWLAAAEPAVSGSGGHNKMFFCCCRMFQMFQLTIDQAWPLILAYNDRAEPPFSERELRHKVEDAYKKGAK